MNLLGTHHVAVICTDYQRSKHFYAQILGLKIIAETHRVERLSYKLDLELPDGTRIELFSFPDPPPRVNKPEAAGLRHLAFAVTDLDAAVAHLNSHAIVVEPVRVDGLTGKRFTFFADPDGLPLELYEKQTPIVVDQEGSIRGTGVSPVPRVARHGRDARATKYRFLFV